MSPICPRDGWLWVLGRSAGSAHGETHRRRRQGRTPATGHGMYHTLARIKTGRGAGYLAWAVAGVPRDGTPATRLLGNRGNVDHGTCQVSDASGNRSASGEAGIWPSRAG